jgi:hypothetical protein
MADTRLTKIGPFRALVLCAFAAFAPAKLVEAQQADDLKRLRRDAGSQSKGEAHRGRHEAREAGIPTDVELPEVCGAPVVIAAFFCVTSDLRKITLVISVPPRSVSLACERNSSGATLSRAAIRSHSSQLSSD